MGVLRLSGGGLSPAAVLDPFYISLSPAAK
jgi:hypothetical protein